MSSFFDEPRQVARFHTLNFYIEVFNKPQRAKRGELKIEFLSF